MDVKSAFLNGVIQQEVYAEQHPEFKSITFPTMFLNSMKHCMDLTEFQELGMND